MFGPSDQFPLRGKGGAEDTKGGAFLTAEGRFACFFERSEVVWFSK